MSSPDEGFPGVARVFAVCGLVALVTVVTGLALALTSGLDAALPRAFPLPGGAAGVALNAGVALLLALPLLRNAAVLVAALRRGPRYALALATVTTLLLCGVYATVFLLPG
jgi:hypothetical protein